MLTSIQVRNFAIIDEVQIEFDDGMTVLTGETGAGKSILVDAMGLVLGERGSAGLVRRGAKRAEFVAEFDLSNLPDATNWLEEQMLDQDDECNLRRVVGADGRSRAFINGNPVPLQSLKTLGEMLLDIHGQHFHQSLARRDVQRSLLDYYGGLSKQVADTAHAFTAWREVEEKLVALQDAERDRSSRMELLQFQLDEIDAIDLQQDEFEALTRERSVLRHSSRLAEGVTAGLENLDDMEPGNARSLIADAINALDNLVEIDASLEPVLAMLQEAGIQVSESIDALRRYADGLEMDPARQAWVEDRLDAIRSVARKHHIEPEGILQLRVQLAESINDLEHSEERSQALRADAKNLSSAYEKIAQRLSTGRKKSAAALASDVTRAMSDLGMPGGRFEVRVTQREAGKFGPHGMDSIVYLISANPGQDPMPLAKVASGGELSRMSLAIQVVASGGSRIPTMVFDEVDSGVGGGIAEMVGMRLRDLGQTRQVFCVTHLPQVASLGDHHFRITKLTDGKSTRTAITRLTEDERVEEIARMLGGVEITRRTREHAAEMLSKAPRTPGRGMAGG